MQSIHSISSEEEIFHKKEIFQEEPYFIVTAIMSLPQNPRVIAMLFGSGWVSKLFEMLRFSIIRIKMGCRYVNLLQTLLY